MPCIVYKSLRTFRLWIQLKFFVAVHVSSSVYCPCDTKQTEQQQNWQRRQNGGKAGMKLCLWNAAFNSAYMLCNEIVFYWTVPQIHEWKSVCVAHLCNTCNRFFVISASTAVWRGNEGPQNFLDTEVSQNYPCYSAFVHSDQHLISPYNVTKIKAMYTRRELAWCLANSPNWHQQKDRKSSLRINMLVSGI